METAPGSEAAYIAACNAAGGFPVAATAVEVGCVSVYAGDSREVLKGLAAGSIDAVVTDPPYALVSITKRFGKPGSVAPKGEGGMAGAYQRASAGFLGKEWDTGETAFDPEFWREVWRVLKPGGHVAAFGGTRAVHRLTAAIEDAGFEIRDMIAWLYGSGFPKSHDVAKAIDKSDVIGPRRERALKFTAWMRSLGVAAGDLNAATASHMGSHYLTAGEQPEIPTRPMFEAMRPLLLARKELGAEGVPAWVEELVDSRTVESANLARREVVGEHAQPAQAAVWRETYDPGAGVAPPGKITRAYSDDAKEWEGWGTALKPALEPIVLARKPLVGTIAENVLAHGTGALNIDACRVGESGGTAAITDTGATGDFTSGLFGQRGGSNAIGIADIGKGRWPANVVHDGSAEVEAAFPSYESPAPRMTHRSAGVGSYGGGFTGGNDEVVIGYGDDGSAARFFYSAKADAEDRLGSKHPTVKPVDLMRWLCRLITPPGGVVLDPFAGSGSTGVAAHAEGFAAVLIEREAEYVADILRRIRWAHGQAEETTGQLVARRREQKGHEGLELFGGGDSE